MPGLDRTGPSSEGPKTGNGGGRCHSHSHNHSGNGGEGRGMAKGTDETGHNHGQCCKENGHGHSNDTTIKLIAEINELKDRLLKLESKA